MDAPRTRSRTVGLLLGLLVAALAVPAAAGAQTSAALGVREISDTPQGTDDAQRLRAVQFLESIQRETYLSLGRQPPVYDKPFLDRFIERFVNSPGAATMTPQQKRKVVEDLEKIARSPLRSRYEDPFGYSIVEALNDQIKAVIASSSVTLAGAPVFGTLPTRRVNARTFAVPDSTNVVIAFEDQMFEFALLFSKAAAYGFPGTRSAAGGAQFSSAIEEIKKHIESDPQPRQRFQEVLSAYVFAGRPGAAPQYFQPQPHSALADSLRESMELFILGHEYGHFIANHLQQGRQVKSAIGAEEVTEIVRSWTDEFEADALGLQLSIAAMRNAGYDVSLSYWGADFFFTTLDIVDRALRLVATGAETDADFADASRRSHPPAQWRRQYLRKAIEAQEKDGSAGSIQLAEAVQFAAELMWEKARPAFAQAHESGRRAHPSWQH